MQTVEMLNVGKSRQTWYEKSLEGRRSSQAERQKSFEGRRSSQPKREKSLERRRSSQPGREKSLEGRRSSQPGREKSLEGRRSSQPGREKSIEGRRSSRRGRQKSLEAFDRASQVEQVERMGPFFRPIWPTGPRFWVAGVISDRFLERLTINFRLFPLRARSRNANSATCVSTCKNAYEKRVQPHARFGKIANNCPEIDASSEKSIEGRRSSHPGREKSLEGRRSSQPGREKSIEGRRSSRRGRQKSLEAFDRASQVEPGRAGRANGPVRSGPPDLAFGSPE